MTDLATVSPADLSGLCADEVAERRRLGQANKVEQRTARSVSSIIRANVATRFNAIITALAVVILAFGDPIDAMFAIVMILNSTIGIVQEIRAKRSLDALQVFIVPSVDVLRDGATATLAPSDLVLDDVIGLTTGDQVPVDGQVLNSHGLEVDESALTGESEPVPKHDADEVLSGSAVVAGSAWVLATRVGEDCWAQQITREAKDFVLTESELRRGVDSVLRVVSWMLPGLSALLVWTQLQANSSLEEGLVFSVAGVVAIVPQGLVLLVSMALAVAVVRLGQRNVVVQELSAVEGLARIDVLCVDKTGTLTTGELAVDNIEYLAFDDSIISEAGLGALTQLDGGRTSTMAAIAHEVTAPLAPWVTTAEVQFSSVRKWSGASFADRGTFVLGAPEIVLAGTEGFSDVLSDIVDLSSSGRRVVLLAHSEAPLLQEKLPTDLVPAAIVSLKEELRSDAAETLAYFGRQNVAIKVISGDHPQTVAAVASELGVPNADRFVEMTNINAFYILQPGYIDASLDEIVKQYGSMEKYIRNGLGITVDEIRSLRNSLLEL